MTNKKKYILIKFFLQIVIGVFFIMLSQDIYAQCGDELVEKAIEKSGVDALFLRDFKIRQSKRKAFRKPNANFSVHLKEGLTYRFLIENDINSKDKAILQLYDNNLLLAATYNPESKTDEKVFDYLCSESNEYQVVLSFLEKKEGCAVGVMSLVITDSTSMTDFIKQNEIQNDLYVGVDNYIDIAMSDNPKGKVKVKASRGKVRKSNGLYKVNVDTEGPVTIEAIAMDSIGNIKESVKSEFIVRTPILPEITLNGNTGGIITKNELISRRVSLGLSNINSNMKINIIEFSISRYINGQGVSTTKTDFLSPSQISLLKELKDGDTFYINDIIVENEHGTRYKLKPAGFIITDNNTINTPIRLNDGHQR